MRGWRGFVLALFLQAVAYGPYISLLPILGASAGYVSTGEDHAVWLWQLERFLGVAFEPSLSSWFLSIGGERWAAFVDLVYIWPHLFVMAFGWLVLWLWRRELVWYYLAVWALIEAVWNVAGLFLPVAPPRLTPGIAQHIVMAPGAYDAYVAVPSVHVAVGLLFAEVYCRAFPRLGWLWSGYGVGMCIWVLVTGNHWVLDVGAGLLLYVVARIVVRGLGPPTVHVGNQVARV